ncbi:MAG: NAD(P)-dependent oxidoreductase, partial [Pseudomonadota bacterium]
NLGGGAPARHCAALSLLALGAEEEAAARLEQLALRPDAGGEAARAAILGQAGWRALGEESGVPVHIFRLAGIYGPGRSAFDSLKAGTARRIVKPGQVFSRIHVEDIATILVASVSKAGPGEVYNVCDDEAAPPQDVIAYAAELMGVAPPPEIPFDQAELSPMAQSFYRDNKRVRNDKIKQALGVALAYPTYREGLRALLPST